MTKVGDLLASTASSVSTAPEQPGQVVRSRAGRPTREQAEARFEELLDTALDLFLKNGYEMTTIESIASAVNMTKRTVYVKFEDKAALFLTAVQRAIEREVTPLADMVSLDRGDLRETLEGIARLRIMRFMTPSGLRLQRIIQAESYRFPRIADWHYQQSSLPVLTYVAGLLQRGMQEGEIVKCDPHQGASAFMSLVVGSQMRTIVGGRTPSSKDIDQKVSFTVRLLLDGLRQR